jgi:enoyl-CoA hydratase/carnithine racemase
MEVARTIAALPPLAIQTHRRILGSMATPTVAASLREELMGQMLVYNSEDFAEFKAARREERPPNYRGT